MQFTYKALKPEISQCTLLVFLNKHLACHYASVMQSSLTKSYSKNFNGPPRRSVDHNRETYNHFTWEPLLTCTLPKYIPSLVSGILHVLAERPPEWSFHGVCHIHTLSKLSSRFSLHLSSVNPPSPAGSQERRRFLLTSLTLDAKSLHVVCRHPLKWDCVRERERKKVGEWRGRGRKLFFPPKLGVRGAWKGNSIYFGLSVTTPPHLPFASKTKSAVHLDGHQSYTIISKKDAKINITFGCLFCWRVGNYARTVPLFLYLCFFSSHFGFTGTSRFKGELLCFRYYILSALLRMTLWFQTNNLVLNKQICPLACHSVLINLYLLNNQSSHCAYKWWHLQPHKSWKSEFSWCNFIVRWFILLMLSSKLEC